MRILYQDNDIIVVYKDYGISSQRSDGKSMLDLIEDATEKIAFPVHRLDITTSGVMVYALSKQSASALCAQVAGGELDKTYLAVVHGETPEHCEAIDFLFHDRLKNKSFIVDERKKSAKRASLEFSTLGQAFCNDEVLSLLKIKLHTGRTHQIRVQLSHRGFPLYGDGKYGAHDNGKIALHSYSLAFIHPRTKKKLCFYALPDALGAWELFDLSMLCE